VVVSMEYKSEVLQTIHKGETMKKVTEEFGGGHVTPGGWKREEAKLECGVLSELQMKTRKKRRKERHEEINKKYSKKKENEFAAAQWHSWRSPTPNFTKISQKIRNSRMETNLRPSLPYDCH